jgi:iron complex outermembrane receptor protein
MKLHTLVLRAARCRGSLALTLLGVATLILADAARADADQSAAGASVATGLSEVVVTARKISENLQTVPLAVTAISGADIKLENIRLLTDVQSQVPSLIFQADPDDAQGVQVTMRGRKQNDVTLAVDPSVGLYVDGLYVPRTLGLAGALLDVARIEVLRGPQGTLFGQNTTSGAVTITTNNPTDSLGGSVDVSGGNFSAWSAVGILNIPLGTDVAARFVAARAGHSGYGENLVGDPLNSEDSQYYRAKFAAKLGSWATALLSAHYESNTSGGLIEKVVGIAAPANGLPAGGVTTLEIAGENNITNDQALALLQSYVTRSTTHFYDTSGDFPTSSTIKKWDVNLNLSGDVSDSMHWRSITGAQEMKRDGLFGSPIPGELFHINFHTVDKYYSQEFQLIGSHRTVNWVAGLYGSSERGQDDTSALILPVLLGPTPSEQNASIFNSSIGVFGQAIWEFVPTWRLTLGARYSRDDKGADVNNFMQGACVVPAPGVESTLLGPSQCPRTFENRFSQPTWLVSLDHRLTSDTLLYAKAASGYRSGGQNTAGAIEIETFQPFQPEKNIEYELGVKSDLFDRRLRLNLAAYYDTYTDLQVTTTFIAADGAVDNSVTNAAKARIQGIEADSWLVVNSHLSLRASAAYTDAHYLNFVDFTGDRTDQAFPVPRWSGGVGGRWVQPTSAGDFTFNIDYYFRSSTIYDATGINLNDVTQPAYGVLNARLNLNIRAWNCDVAVFGNNITGTKYYEDAHGFDSSLGINLGIPGDPAIFGVEVIKRFGAGF